MKRIPNEQQNAVINNLTDNIILFASAGTGKTFTVANRVANILANGNASAQEILCLTFTIKASKEMAQDILSYVGENAKEVFVNTIHGFCYRLLLEENRRMYNKYCDLGVCDEIDEEEILRSILSSRYAYWLLAEECVKQAIPMPDLEKCPICMIEGSEELFFKFEDYLIDFDGKICEIEKSTRLVESQIYCPTCMKMQPITDRICPECGNLFDFRLNKRNFDIFHKKTGIRNVVSELKHYRERGGFYTENTRQDYQKAFAYIKENNLSLYENLLSYSARYIGITLDEEFALAMERFVGVLALEYDEYLTASDLVDFDDIILQANAYLNNEEIFARWSTRFKYIIVDEMQDTSTLEYQLLKKIFAKNNVMLCGDFFQTIYQWRGSNPEKILDEYIKNFSAKIYMFSENYRATKTLASATFAYLQNTYPQLMGKYCPKQLQINSPTDGEKITCHAFSNREEEAWKIYKYLQAQKGQSTNNVCIIARTNKYIAELYRYFEQFNSEEEDELRFFTVEENFNFFKKPVVKDILSVLRLLVNRLDRISLERLTEKYVKNVGVKSIENLRGLNEIGVSILSFIDPQTHLYGDNYHHLIEGYQEENIVIYDTETTGLDLSKDQIVQISAIKIGKTGEIIDTLDLMVEPTIEICQAAYETHGFDLEYIRQHGGLTTMDALQRFSNFVKGCVLVGHNNLAYDKPLVTRQLKENLLPDLDILAEYDTLVIAKQFYPSLFNFKLATLCEQFAIINECAHNALGDITATGQCLVAMLKEKILPTTTERVAVLTKYREKFAKIYAFMEEIRSRLQNNEELATYIIERLNLAKRYATRADYLAMRDIVETLKPSEEDMETYLKGFLQDAALSSSQMDVLIQKLNRIPIITVHQAKGCEFDTVILAGADDNHFPSYAARQTSNEDEEKKVFYVAITRAKQKLVLTRALRNGKYELNETPYFWMIPEEYIQTNHAWRIGN